MFQLSGKVALVTGAATGLGQAIALALVQNDAQVAISDKRVEDLDETEKLLKSITQNVFKVAIDVRDLKQVRRGVQATEAALTHIDILVNNAGVNRPAAAADVSADNWDDHFNTNVRGAFFVAQAVAKGMVERKWGRIIFISSQSGLVGIPGQPVYCATRGAVIQLVRALRLEWAKSGITVNSIAPTLLASD
jgi:NAD(P)-dependent dehydrogenase (short-subunit alcohol dehydrogenase family)